MIPAPPDWEDLDLRAETLVAEAEQTAVRWEWARSAADWEMPFELWEQRFGRNPVTTASKGNPDPSLSVHYGYDEDDEIILARRFTGDMPDTERVWKSMSDGAPALFEIGHIWRPDGWRPVFD